MRHELRVVGVLLMAVSAVIQAQGQASFYESFDNVGPTNPGQDGPASLIAAGWIFRNQSAPVGTQSWMQGATLPGYPLPHHGAGYLAVTSSSTDFFGGKVSNWAVLPAIPGQQAGDELRFYVYDSGGSNINTLQVRYSPSGGTSTGSGANAVGDFTVLLQDVNPLPVGGWNLVSATLPGNGRVALRYYIENACNWGCFASYTGLDSLSVGVPPPPPCNMPPVPAAGQNVVWALSGSPYQVCQNIGIPPGATVLVEAGVQVTFDAGMQLAVSGALRLAGSAADRISLDAPTVFPPMVVASGGVIEADFADFSGQVLVRSGSETAFRDCGFSGFGLLRTDPIPAAQPYVLVERCTFVDGANVGLTDALAIVRDSTLDQATLSILRGYALLQGANIVTGGALFVTREESIQPMSIGGVSVTGSPVAGLALDGGTYRIEPDANLFGNPYPLRLYGGLTPDSVLPLSGNAINAIDVGVGGFAGDGRWPSLGLPYRLTGVSGNLPGGHLTIDPGVMVEAAHANAAMIFRSTRHGVLKGLPESPISFRGLNGQNWDGLAFITNASTGSRLEYCTVQHADFGAVSSDNGLYVDNCFFTQNQVGANANTYGTIYFAGTRFVANGVGVSFTDLGSPVLDKPTNPNSFEGNGAGLDAFEPGSSADARHCWWGHPSGPLAPGNPGGLGDAFTGVGAAGVQYQPFLTAAPDFANRPPVVRMVEPGLTRLYASPDYSHSDFLLDAGTRYIARWDVQSDAVATQRIEFSPDGHYPSRYTVLVDSIPPDARSWEFTIPNPGFAVTNQPQFLKVVAVDATGREGWDQTPVLVPSGNIGGELTITTDLSGQTFVAGQPIPDMHWTGSVTGFPSIKPLVVLEGDGAAVLGLNLAAGHGQFFQKFPYVSTDTARLALLVRNNSNDAAWFFADGYFSIRHDPRLGLTPPTVTLLTPQHGAAYPGGDIVPIAWTAAAPEGLRSFDIQASYDAARTWHPIVRDLPGTAEHFDWRLPPSDGIADVRVRVIVRDQRFQNSSDGAARVFSITPGQGGIPGDLDGDGHVNQADLGILLASFGKCEGDAGYNPVADIDGDGCVGQGDLGVLLANFGG